MLVRSCVWAVRGFGLNWEEMYCALQTTANGEAALTVDYPKQQQQNGAAQPYNLVTRHCSRTLGNLDTREALQSFDRPLKMCAAIRHNGMSSVLQAAQNIVCCNAILLYIYFLFTSHVLPKAKNRKKKQKCLLKGRENISRSHWSTHTHMFATS